MKQAAAQQIISLLEKGSNPCVDSRAAEPGDIFFALQGELLDGNRFAKKALEAGCLLAVVDKEDYVKGDKYILVEDVLTFLQQLSHAYRKLLHIPVIAITGSNGKTTTKELMQAILSKAFASAATHGNLNNHIGVPLTLLSLKKPLDVAIIEMGANHREEIAGLCQLAMPSHGLITNIGKAHLEGFGNIDNITTAKTELFHYLEHNNGTRFVNSDDPRLAIFTDQSDTITYGSLPINHCTGNPLKSFPYLEVGFRVNKDFGKAVKGMEGSVKSWLTGSYNFENILAAITTGLFFGVPPKSVIEAIETYQPENHRSQIIQTKHNMVLMDSYNANPTSMAAALENFSRFEGPGKAVILGDMLELGTESEKEHKIVLALVKEKGFAKQLFVGDHFVSVCRPDKCTKVFSTVDDTARWLSNNPLRGYKILVKGSRGIKMENLLKHL